MNNSKRHSTTNLTEIERRALESKLEETLATPPLVTIKAYAAEIVGRLLDAEVSTKDPVAKRMLREERNKLHTAFKMSTAEELLGQANEAERVRLMYVGAT